MVRVAHYVERWLELSAGFVASQVGRSRHDSVVISRDGWLHLDAFPVEPRHSLHRIRDRLPARLKATALHAQLDYWLRRERIDLVHVHFGYAANDIVRHAGRGRPFVLSLHGHDVTGLLRDQPHHYDRVVGAVDAVIVPSGFLADRATSAGFPVEAVHVIPSGVDLSYFTPSPLPDGAPMVAFVGRLVEKKGLDVLLKAWPAVRAAIPDARLVVLGAGELARLLDGADGSITHLAPEPSRRHHQVRELIRSSTVVATPSRTAVTGDSESLLLVNLEAGASGRPVVTTRHGGIPEFVTDDGSGLVVEEGDADQLAGALVRVLADRDLAARLGAGGVEQAARWDASHCAHLVDHLYDDVLARRFR